MTTVVTYSEFRDNLSKYINVLKKKGSEVVLKDGRNGREVIRLKKADKKDKFDWDEHTNWIKNFKPIFTDRDVKQIKEVRRKSRERTKKLDW